MALEKLKQLKLEAAHWWWLPENLPDIQYDSFVHFITKQVHPVLQRTARELLLVRSMPPDLARSVMASFIGHSIIQQDDSQSCALCFPSQEEHILRGFQGAEDVGGEYIAHEHRLATHLRHGEHRSGLVGEDELIEKELLHLSALSSQIVSNVVLLFERYEMKEAAETARSTDVLQDDYIGCWLFAKGRRQKLDCLNRSTLHQWLDLSQANLDEASLRVLRSKAPLFSLRHRDILGRTPLDIARIQRSGAALEILVDCESSQARIVLEFDQYTSLANSRAEAELRR
jgi:hypothetical protein